jgi:hypothetical protein
MSISPMNYTVANHEALSAKEVTKKKVHPEKAAVQPREEAPIVPSTSDTVTLSATTQETKDTTTDKAGFPVVATAGGAVVGGGLGITAGLVDPAGWFNDETKAGKAKKTWDGKFVVKDKVTLEGDGTFVVKDEAGIVYQLIESTDKTEVAKILTKVDTQLLAYDKDKKHWSLPYELTADDSLLSKMGEKIHLNITETGVTIVSADGNITFRLTADGTLGEKIRLNITETGVTAVSADGNTTFSITADDTLLGKVGENTHLSFTETGATVVSADGNTTFHFIVKDGKLEADEATKQIPGYYEDLIKQLNLEEYFGVLKDKFSPKALSDLVELEGVGKKNMLIAGVAGVAGGLALVGVAAGWFFGKKKPEEVAPTEPAIKTSEAPAVG